MYSLEIITLCQCCKGKSKDKILNVHHIESRKTGGDSPRNLITFCETCHNGYHKGKIQIPKTSKEECPLEMQALWVLVGPFIIN